jgi:outer membrane usher protein
MRRYRIERVARFVLLVVAFTYPGARADAQLTPIESNPAALSQPRQLRLEVWINGVSTHLVEPFVWIPSGRLSIARGDLEDVGVRAPGRGDLQERIFVDAIPGVESRFDEPLQRIAFRLLDAQRLPRVYDARGVTDKSPPPHADWGVIVNYTLYAASLNTLPALPKFTGANVTLDARAVSPFGTLSQTGIVGNTLGGVSDYLRLDSALSYSDPDSMLTARGGDSISGGLAWTRPVRYGGLQVQRDFTLRPDLVTQPVPIISGTAAVPSTVDVFLNDVKAFSQNVGAGPYQILNLPIVSNSGTAKVVATDASGRQIESSAPFYSSPTQLAKGLVDFSLDAGLARRAYALLSNDYDTKPIGSATLRRGLNDRLTLESHAEGGAGLVNAGLGLVSGLGPWGTFSAASAASHFNGNMGYQAYAAYDLQFRDFTLDISSQRTFAGYSDLASATAAQPQYGPGSLPAAFGYGLVSAATSWDPRPAKALDRISVGGPLPFDKTSLSVSFINLIEADNSRSAILAASLTRQLPWNASLYATAFVDIDHRNSGGLFAGLSIPFGADISASIGVSSGGGGASINFEAQKTLQNVDGAYGWQIRDSEGATPYRSAETSYRSSYGIADVGVQQQNGAVGGSARIDGSIAAMGGGVFLGNHIRDSFAVIDAGVPGVTVLEDNRPVGVTNAWGKFMAPDLRSYQVSKIGIDPVDLPSGAEAGATQMAVSAANHGGVYVDFGVTKDVHAAIVTLVGPDGKFLPAGSKGHLAGSDESFVVGYDGQAYVKRLTIANIVVAENGDTECQASFAYTPATGRRTIIGPLTCR